jgi:hypothetical protein
MLMTIIKVDRKIFNRKKQAELSIYAQEVVSKTFEIPKYVALAAEVADLKEKSDAYALALVAAASRDKDAVAEKNVWKVKLIQSFNFLSNSAENNCDGDASFITEMGLSVKQKNVRNNLPKQIPERPDALVIQPLAIPGCVDISFILHDRKHILMVAVEWKIVGTEQWTNGTYFAELKGILKGLPSRADVEIRLRSLGRNDLKSIWTTQIPVAVY